MKRKEDAPSAKCRSHAKRIAPRHADRRIPSYEDAAEIAMRSRIRRPSERWTGLEEASRIAQIVVLEHGGHANPIIKRGQTHLRSRLVSAKTGIQQVIEGRGHRDLAMWNDVNPQILDYEAHPFLIHGQADGERFDSYPDHIRLWRNGLIELIEVKRSVNDLGDRAYRRKLGAVAEIARRVGWSFRVLYHDCITGPPWRMPNVEAIYARRFLEISSAEQYAIAEFVLGTSTTWETLRERVAPGDRRRGNAVLQNAIARGQIDVDLDQRITNATIVTPLAPMFHNDQIRI